MKKMTVTQWCKRVKEPSVQCLCTVVGNDDDDNCNDDLYNMNMMKKMTVTQWCKRGLTEPSVYLLLRRVRLIWSPLVCPTPHLYMWMVMVMILMMLVVAALFSIDY